MHKKVTTCLMFTILIVNIAAISTDIASNESFPTVDNKKILNSAPNSTLIYGDFEYDKLNASTTDKICWTFSSSNDSVKITVIAMDSANFSFFNNNTQPFSYATLSPGNVTGDSGTFSPKYSDTWYIIYLNNDTDMQQDTMLSYNTTLVSKISNISITSPDSTSYWIRGSYYYIKWYTIGNISNVNINLFNNGSYYYTIDINVYNNGSYYWELPLNLPPSYFYQIMITDTHNSTAHYFSSYFFIVTKVSFEITAPSSYSSWKEGYTYHIYWKTVGSIPRVNLFLYLKDNYYLTIITNLNNVESYFWTLPSSLPSSGPYKIKIEDVSNLLTYGFSDDFYINGIPSNNYTNTSLTTPGLWTIVVFALLLLVLFIFLGVRRQGRPRPYQPKLIDETHKNSQLSRVSMDMRQVSESEDLYYSQKPSLESNISILQNICPICGIILEDRVRICPECGYRLVRDY